MIVNLGLTPLDLIDVKILIDKNMNIMYYNIIIILFATKKYALKNSLKFGNKFYI